LLIGFVAADNASCNGPDFAVPCQMARDATNDGALNASLCLSGSRGKRYTQKGGTKDQRLHGSSPKKQVAATIPVAVIGSEKAGCAPDTTTSPDVPAPARIRYRQSLPNL
jgi:hypothetical protein